MSLIDKLEQQHNQVIKMDNHRSSALQREDSNTILKLIKAIRIYEEGLDKVARYEPCADYSAREALVNGREVLTE